MGSLPEERHKLTHCTACGAWWKNLSVHPLPAIPEYTHEPLCGECIQKWNEGEVLRQAFVEPLPEPPDETFRELFKVARVLLREHVTDEDQIIPTLVAAHEIACGAANPWVTAETHHWIAAKNEVLQMNLERPPRTRNVRVVKVVDGTLILEWEPISAQLVSSSWSEDNSKRLLTRWESRPWSGRLTDKGHPYRGGILIRVYPYKHRVAPDEVASHYQAVLALEGMSFGSPRDTLMEYRFTGTCLYLVVAAGGRRSRNEVIFPSPSLVEYFYRGVLQEFGERLVARKAGPSARTNLIPACVAFFLRASGGLSSPKEIECLLNEYVWESEKYIPGSSVSENVQLWRDVKIAQRQVMRLLPGMQYP